MNWKNKKRLILVIFATLLLLGYATAHAQAPPLPPPADPDQMADDICGDVPGDDQPITGTGDPPNGCYNSDHALLTAATDDAKPGYCAKGVSNILISQGFDITRVHYAKDYGAMLLAKGGWVKENYTAATAPIGAVLVYTNTPPLTTCCPGGNVAGHVEIVTQSAQGRVYVSDKARVAPSPRPLIGVYVYHGTAKDGTQCG